MLFELSSVDDIISVELCHDDEIVELLWCHENMQIEEYGVDLRIQEPQIARAA